MGGRKRPQVHAEHGHGVALRLGRGELRTDQQMRNRIGKLRDPALKIACDHKRPATELFTVLHDFARGDRCAGLADSYEQDLSRIDGAGPIGLLIVLEHRWILSFGGQVHQMLEIIRCNLGHVIRGARPEENHLANLMLFDLANKRVNEGGALSEHALQDLRLTLDVAEYRLFHIASFHTAENRYRHERRLNQTCP